MNTSLTTSQSSSLALSHSQPLDRNPAAVYLHSLAPGSRRAMLGALNTIADLVSSGQADAHSLDWSALRFQHTTAIRSALAERYKPATVNKMLSALRQVLKRAWRLGQMTQEEYARAADLDGIKGSTVPAGRAISDGEKRALMAECGNDPTPAGARDAAIIAIWIATGLRRAEMIGLDLADYDAEAGELLVHGKRHKDRLVPVVNGAAEALADWLSVRGDDRGPLFVPIRKGGHMQHGNRLTTEALWHMLKRRATGAGIASLSPHDMRRTVATELWERGANPVAIQKLLGHASLQTTARYDRSGEKAKRKAAELIHVPYTRRRLAV